MQLAYLIKEDIKALDYETLQAWKDYKNMLYLKLKVCNWTWKIFFWFKHHHRYYYFLQNYGI